MATKRNQVTLYFRDDEYGDLVLDAGRAQQDLNAFAKHCVLSRSKLKVKALPKDAAAEIARQETIITELQRQLDTFQAEKGKSDTLGSLIGATAPKTLDELVNERFQKLKDKQDLEDYAKLQKEHAQLKQKLDARDGELGKLRSFDNYMPAIANGLGALLVNKFPDMAHGIASAANAVGGTLGALPAPAPEADGENELSDDETQMLDFGRTVLTAFADPAEMVMLVQTLSAMPSLVPPVVGYVRQLVTPNQEPAPAA